MPGLTISVAMCTFNGARFLGAQLDSVAAQRRLPDEVVICDDGSTDGSIEIAKNFARSMKFPVRLQLNHRNLGSTKNFENAISLCNGMIVALADQDDIWYPQKLEKIEQAFLKSSLIVAAFSDADLIDENGDGVGRRLWERVSLSSAKQQFFVDGHAADVLIRGPIVTGATLAFRRELLHLLAPIPASEIHDRWISDLLAARGLFSLIPEPLMKYREHNSQQMGLGAATMRKQLAVARARGAKLHLGEIARYRTLYERLERRQADFPNGAYVRNKIEGKIRHLEHRAKLPSCRIVRIPGILMRILNGEYWKYSGGWKSIAKDALLRG